MTDEEITKATAYAEDKDAEVKLAYAGTRKGGMWMKDSGTDPVKYTGIATDPTWDATKAYTESGLAMNAKANTVYYLKEVPDTKYLQPYTHYTYYKAAPNNIANLWMLSDLDDNNYTEAGFIITKNDVAKVCKSLTVQNAVGGTQVKLTPQKIFKAKGVTSNNLLTYCQEDAKSGSIDLRNCPDGAQIKMYWATPDKVFVTSAVERTLTSSGTKASISKSDQAIASTIKAAE